jgi:imidazolonepropionase-like amidohydrolase
MNPWRIVSFVLIVLFLPLLNPAVAQEESTRYVQCGSLIDPAEGRVRQNITIEIKGDRITDVRRQGPLPENADVVDLGDATCMPGLFELHAHLLADGTFLQRPYGVSNSEAALIQLRQAQRAMKDGFTTIRSTAEWGEYALVDVRNHIKQGHYKGPRIYVAPHNLSPTGGHGDINNYPPDAALRLTGENVLAGTDNIRERVREEVKYGADWIKISASGGVMSEHDDVTVAGFTQEEMDAWADETHRYKKKITAHVHGNDAAVMAAKAGFDSIEHGTMIEDDAIQLMIENNVWLVPTVWIVDEVARRCEASGAGGPSASSCEKITQVKKVRDQSFRKARAAGVKMAFGVDAIWGVQDNPKEFAALVGLGVSEMEAIQMATSNAAAMLELDDELGSVEPGKRADIVAVAGNPLNDISEMERVKFVMKDGSVYRNDLEHKPE